MEIVTVNKREYDRLTLKLASLEAGLEPAQKLLDNPEKSDWWRRFWIMGAKAAVVALVVLLLLPGVSHALTDDQKALVGLRGVQVVVEHMQPGAERLGLTQAQIKTDVELRLRKARVRVLTKEEKFKTPGMPYLYVAATTYINPATPELFAFMVQVELREWVTLAMGFETYGAIWQTGSLGSVGASNIRGIREDVSDRVDQFINDYLAANPK